ncbi:MAG: phosphoadenylyl-sulfate reductase [Candidatus Limnocylindrales bacterium]|jgi:phosphoadenosine phosphosulfate reductase
MTDPGLSSSPLPPVPPIAESEPLDAQAVLGKALEAIGPDRLALASSFGAEDMVILDMLAGLTARPRVFTLDTGRLPQATYDLMDASRRRYGIEVEVVFPDREAVEGMVRTRGLNLFYDSLEARRTCCGIRKVEPLGRALAGLGGWITGLRRDQVSTRSTTPKLAIDDGHAGIWKVAPLADWSEDQVWAYIRAGDVPYNALHDQGYRSIGCEPCTRAVAEGEDPRAGRWWWERPDERECGIHFDPISGRMTRDRATEAADATIAATLDRREVFDD